MILTAARRWLPLAALPLIVLAGTLFYWPALSVGYLSDDYPWLEVIADPGYSAFDPLPMGTGRYVRPLPTLTMRAERALAGGDALRLHRSVQLGVHLLNGVLLFGLCRMVGVRWGAALGLSALFLFHPAAVPNVYWITSRVDSLLTLWILLALLGFICVVQGGRWGWGALMGVATLLALLTKESGVVVGGILPLAWYPIAVRSGGAPGQGWRRAALPLALVWLVTLAYAGTLWLRLSRGPSGSLPGFSFRDGIEMLVSAALLLVAPGSKQTWLIGVYRSAPWTMPLGLLLLGGGLAVGGWWLWRRGGGETLRLGGALAGLVLLSLAPLALSGALARRLYLTVALLALAGAWLPWQRARVARIGLPALGAVVLLFGAISWRQGQQWVTNWGVVERACGSFRAVAPSVSREQVIVLLGAPVEYGDAPVFANDASGLLFHCATGRFGHFPRLLTIGRFSAPDLSGAGMSVTVAPVGRGKLTLTADPPRSVFLERRGVRVGSSYRGEGVSIVAEAVTGDGAVSRLRVDLSDLPGLDSALLLHFDGLGFTRLHLPMARD